MIDNLVLTTSGKGGVGKSLLTSAIAGSAASGGWRVLVLDLDRSGDLAVNLGYADRSDGGLSLAAAVAASGDLHVLRDVRPGLDVVAGGPHVDRVNEALADAQARGEQPHHILEDIIAPLAAERSLVMIDLPPTAGVVHDAAFAVAGFIAVPTTVDRCSVNGLGAVFERFMQTRATTNPDLELLGVILNGVDMRATTITAEVTARLGDLLGDTVRVFEPPIRWAPKAVYDMREAGLLAAEYHAAAQEETTRRLSRLRRRDTSTPAQRYAANADGFAKDLAQVSDELLAAFVERLTSRRERIDLRSERAVHA